MNETSNTSNTASASAPVATPQADGAQVATTFARINELLREAGQTAQTMYAKIREAAALAASEMDKAKTPAEQVKSVLLMHEKTLAEINDPNVRSTFSSFLWLHAAPAVKVTVPAPTVAGEAKSTKTVDASEAINLSKHTVQDVAKQLRDTFGVGRAAGAGRPQAQPAGVPASAAAPTFFDELETRLGDPGDFARIVAAIEKCGYTVTRKASVTPAEAKPDATAALASALAETVPHSALAQAAKQAAAVAPKKNKGFISTPTK